MSLDPKWTALGIPMSKEQARATEGDPFFFGGILLGMLLVGVALLVGWLA